MNRLGLLYYFFGLMLIGCSTEVTEVDRPNIIWIVSEDNSPLIGAYGDEFATTPNIDKMAEEGLLYELAFATAPVCAPARSSLITGIFPSSLGTQHMRSTYKIPDMVHFYPHFLKEAGYYTSNNSKKDYNTIDQPEVWDESGKTAHYKNRSEEDQPFFAIFNFTTSHESSVHKPVDSLRHDAKKVPIPPYHPRTEAMEHDWAQYYDKVEDMDAQVGAILDELEASGLAENTIVFYYSDHGGVLGRSKRYLYESGLHVPLVIRFPEKYQHLAGAEPGSRTNRLVSFIDFPPTLLSLAGIAPPDYMQGQAFLGKYSGEEREYAYSFRGRMDECVDMSRSIRNKEFRYTFNFMPHKIYGQYLEYLWRAPSMVSWEEAYKAGELNAVQSAFWETKDVEELYEVGSDPHNIHNLAKDENYQAVLKEMRQAMIDWMVEVKDVGLYPESMIEAIDGEHVMYDYVRRENEYPIEDLLPKIMAMVSGDESTIIQCLKEDNDLLKYWATQACIMYADMAMENQADLLKLLQDDEWAVKIGGAEALFHVGVQDRSIEILTEALAVDNEKTRLQALNALHTVGKVPANSMAAVKSIIPNDIENRNYDVRSARGLVLKMESNKF
ncbi:sulfatase-like hydrolase/transferase [Membranihabitans marinus]|uniref:sulfatase-like hydrolase/transferase n=1 Tax=Membranihabitans marinus TaxID=1227546 RepID=UPI001F023C4F|nr:sulfatase-like hydrolase/transferase [Membranihabitans marinus]